MLFLFLSQYTCFAHTFYKLPSKHRWLSKEEKMKQTFQVENVKCGGCASTLKSKLKDRFGEVEVDLEKFPREISLTIDTEDIAALGVALKKMGYPLSSDTLGFVEAASTKAKSFISCAIGKMELNS